MSFKRVLGGGVGTTSVPPSLFATLLAIPNIALLLDGDLGITLGGQPLDVSAWADQSGNGRDYTQATTANQPHQVVGDLNGHDSLRFGSPGDQFMDATGAGLIASDLNDLTIFVVGKANVLGGVIWSHRSSTTPLVHVGSVAASNSSFLTMRDNLGNLVQVNPGPAIVVGTVHLFEWVFEPNTPFYSAVVDQGTPVTNVTSLPGTMISTLERIGGTSNNPPVILSAVEDFTLTSLLIYDRSLLAAEITTVRNFLKARYAI